VGSYQRQELTAVAFGSPYGIRTRAATLRGWCPRPLDERAKCLSDASAKCQWHPTPASIMDVNHGCQSSWGERNRTPNNRTRICCVANYTTPHRNLNEVDDAAVSVPAQTGLATPARAITPPNQSGVRIPLTGLLPHRAPLVNADADCEIRPPPRTSWVQPPQKGPPHERSTVIADYGTDR
jgi:hypothetical protein